MDVIEQRVSIISPCYNGEIYIFRFIDSVLKQSYSSSIELIIVDDGSTDATREIISAYKKFFDGQKHVLKYIYQEHAGQAAAINKALPCCSGEYITWMDSDDVLMEESIKKRVEFLQEHPQFDFCCCGMNFVSEDNLKKVNYTVKRMSDKSSRQLFFDLLFERNAIFANAYLVRSKVFFQAHPTKQIYPSKEGQNWQLLLPLAYYYRCGYLQEPLITVVERENSHSRTPRTLEQIIERYDNFRELFYHVFDELHTVENDKLKKLVDLKYAHKKLELVLDIDDKEMMRKNYNFLQENQAITFKDRIYYLLSHFRFLIKPYKFVRYCKHVFFNNYNDFLWRDR